MKIKYVFLGLLLIIPVGQNNISAGIEVDLYQPVKPYDLPIPLLDEQLSQDINIVFAGFYNFSFDLPYLESIIPQSHAPINRIRSDYAGYNIYYNNFTLNYNFKFLDNLFLQDFRDFVYNNGRTDIAPWMLQPNIEYAKYIESELVENFLNTTVMTDKTPTLIILDTYSFDPSGHLPYYYNATTFDYDVDSIPRSYGSTYQIAGGGHNSRILWLDLSAGPTYYRGGVTEENVPPVWNYDPVINNTDFHDDIGSYIKSSVELRMLPSYIYEPVHALEEVKFEFMLVNLDNSSFDYLSVFDPNKVINTYYETNPYIDWTYSISEWNYQTDTAFTDTLSLAFNSTSNNYDGYKILNYLDLVYQNQFNQSTDELRIIPVYLFAFPDDQLFQEFLGIASNIGGQFSYIVAALNNKFADSGIDKLTDIWFEKNSWSINADFYDVFWGTVGANNEVYETTVTINSGSLDFYLVDSYNYELFKVNSSFTYEKSIPGVASSFSFNQSVNLWVDYYWVFDNPGGSVVNFDIVVNKYSKRSFGYTFVVIHEVGHALGLSHPHDGFSWTDGEYLDWLWDLSYTPMTYAHHHSDLSIFDIDTLRRGAFPLYLEKITSRIISFRNDIAKIHTYIPESIYVNLVSLLDHLLQSMILFHDYSKLQDDLSHFGHLFSAFDLLNQLYLQLSDSLFSVSINILNLPTEGNISVIIEYPGFYLKSDLTSLINLNNVSWSDMILNIYHDSVIVYTFSGYTWEIPVEIDLGIDASTTSLISTILDIPTVTITNPSSFINYIYSPLFLFALPVLKILRRGKNIGKI